MTVSARKVSLAMHIKAIRLVIIVAALSVFLDQLTKAIVRKYVAARGVIEVISGFFEIRYIDNTGAAFGMFRGRNTIFIIISILVIGFVFVYYRQFKGNLWMRLSLGLLLGGALGNLIDRVIFRSVTDFIRVRWWFIHLRWWPIFNLADAFICIGAAMLMAGMFRRNEFTEE